MVTTLCVCALAARLLASCKDGSVTGQDPPEDADPFPLTRDDDTGGDAWTELFDDVGKDVTDAAQTDAQTDAARTDARPADGAAAPDPCAIRADGTWCAALLGLPSTGLLRCTGGRSMGTTACPDGCLDRAGATDACLDDSIDPCFNERDGLYCGRAIGSATHADDAFRCAYHRTSWEGACSGGCSMTGATVNCQR
jgi:hypothetical protein